MLLLFHCIMSHLEEARFLRCGSRPLGTSKSSGKIVFNDKFITVMNVEILIEFYRCGCWAQEI